MLLKEFCSCKKFDQSQTFLQKLWPILTDPTEILTNPAYSLRKFDQSCPLMQKHPWRNSAHVVFDHSQIFLQKFWPVLIAPTEFLPVHIGLTNPDCFLIKFDHFWALLQKNVKFCFLRNFDQFCPLPQNVCAIQPTPAENLTYRQTLSTSLANQANSIIIVYYMYYSSTFV